MGRAPMIPLADSVAFSAVGRADPRAYGRMRLFGSGAFLAAALSALQTFLRFSERAEKHVVAADWYSAIRRDLDQLLALAPEERGRPKDCFDRIRKEMSKVGQQSPEIGDRMWDAVAARYGLATRGTPAAL